MKNNEDGFVLVLAMLFLVILSLVALSGMRSSKTELMIAGNSRIAKINFYNAEAAAYEGVQINLNKINPEDLLPAIGDAADNPELRAVTDELDDEQNYDIAGDGIETADAGDAGSETKDMINTTLDPGLLDGATVATVVVLNEIPSGSSLALGATRLYDYTSYGYSTRNNGIALVKVGFKRRF